MNIHRHSFLDVALATLAAIFFFLVVTPALASAAAGELPPPQSGLALPSVQLWTLVAGAIVPLMAYVLNHYAPWASEKIKALVQVVAAAVAGAIVQAIDAGNVGLNEGTLQLVLTAVIAALFAHRILWKPSGISTALGGGQNVQDNPAR